MITTKEQIASEVSTEPAQADQTSLKKRAGTGIAALTGRRIVVLTINLIGTTILLRTLPLEAFGIYVIAAFIIALAGYLADAGMGYVLIQREQPITERDLKVVFTIQFTLLSAAALLVILLSPLIRAFYSLPAYAAPMLMVLSFALFISVFRTVPTIILERRLDYRKFSISDIVEYATFQMVAVPLGLMGAGAWSFIVAYVTQVSVASIMLFVLCPWKPGLAFTLREATSLLRFGALVQSKVLLNFGKDNVTPTLIALTSGPLAVGYVGFAQKLAAYPLLAQDAVARVAFPAYARLQNDLVTLKSAIEKTVKLVNLLLFPTTGLLIVLADPLSRLVLGPKWLPALPAFYLFAVANLTAGTSNVLLASLYALGKPGIVLRLTVLWAVATWALAVPFVLLFGWIGFSLAMVILSVLLMLPLLEVRKVVPVLLLKPLLKPAFSAAVTTAVMWIARPLYDRNILAVLAAGALGLAIFVGLELLLEGRWLMSEFAAVLPASVSERVQGSRFKVQERTPDSTLNLEP